MKQTKYVSDTQDPTYPEQYHIKYTYVEGDGFERSGSVILYAKKKGIPEIVLRFFNTRFPNRKPKSVSIA